MNLDHEAIAAAEADLAVADAKFDELCAQHQQLRVSLSVAAEARRAAIRKLRNLRHPGIDQMTSREYELEAMRRRIAEALQQQETQP